MGKNIALYRPLPVDSDRILDAPYIVDDFYLNILDWSRRNILTTALKNKVYIWNPETS
jgi:hypothetical protein